MTGAVLMGMFYLQVLHLSIDLYVSIELATPFPFCCAGPFSCVFKLITFKKGIVQEKNFYCINLIFWVVFLLLPLKQGLIKIILVRGLRNPPKTLNCFNRNTQSNYIPVFAI